MLDFDGLNALIGTPELLAARPRATSSAQPFQRSTHQLASEYRRWAPAAISASPSSAARRCPCGISFSIAIAIDSAAIQARFMTPPTKRSAINAQQQPRQKRPWRRPMMKAPGCTATPLADQEAQRRAATCEADALEWRKLVHAGHQQQHARERGGSADDHRVDPARGLQRPLQPCREDAEGRPHQQIGTTKLRERAVSPWRRHSATKASTIGSADGSIIAAIITAHMHHTASRLSQRQADDIGIVNLANGWSMSKVIQASEPHPTRLSTSGARPVVSTTPVSMHSFAIHPPLSQSSMPARLRVFTVHHRPLGASCQPGFTWGGAGHA